MGSRGLVGKHVSFFIRNSGSKVSKIARDLCIKPASGAKLSYGRSSHAETARYVIQHEQDIPN